MSNCSYTAFSAPQPIRGQINWANGHRPTPLSYARFVNGEERRAESVELDGVEYAPVRECEWQCGIGEGYCEGHIWRDDDGKKQQEHFGVASHHLSCGHVALMENEDGLNNPRPSYCPECGARVIWGGDD